MQATFSQILATFQNKAMNLTNGYIYFIDMIIPKLNKTKHKEIKETKPSTKKYESK